MNKDRRHSRLLASVACAGCMLLAGAPTAYAQNLDQLRGLFGRSNTTAAPPASETEAVAAAMAANEQILTPGGYALSFEQVRSYMAQSDYASARSLYAGESGQDSSGLSGFVSTKDKFLRNVELGALSFEQGDTQLAVEHLNEAEADAVASDQKERKKGWRGALGKIAGGAQSLGAGLIGRESLAPYPEQDFERILQLNYLTLAYLLEGEFSSFNVTKRAIVSQTIAREKFIEELEEAGKTIEDLEQEQSAENPGSTAQSSQLNFFNAFTQYDSIATRVPSAYVNPLGYYVNAVVLEIDSSRKPELRGNARESYRKALELAPNSSTIAAAYQELSAPEQAASGPTVHVIAAKGYAPTRKVLAYGLQVDTRVIPLKLPVYVPNVSNVSRIDVSAAGVGYVTLDPIADIEAIVMRSQKDRLPIIWSKVGVQAFRSVTLQNLAGNSQLGALAYGVAEGLQSPDTRSWATLPADVSVARLHLPAGSSSVTIQSRTGNGAVLATQTVSFDPASKHVVVYARAADSGLTARVNKPLWISN